MESIEVPVNCADVPVDTIISTINKLQTAATRLTDHLVDRMMIEELPEEVDKDTNRFCTRPCGEKNCQLCDYIYTKSFIVNRNDPTKSYIFEEHFSCKSFEKGDDNGKGGVYAIICVKPNCPYRGVVVFGESEKVKLRLLSYLNLIRSNSKSEPIRPIHRHFIDDHEGDEPLRYFRCALIKEVTGGKEKRLEMEKKMYLAFRTRGKFGFNINQSKDKDESEEPQPKKSKRVPLSDKVEFSASPAYLDNLQRGNPKEREISQWHPVVLAIKSCKTIRQNPTRSPHSATLPEIRSFLDQYFKPEKLVNFETLKGYLVDNVTPTSRIAQNDKGVNHTKWFIGEKKTATGVKSSNGMWVYSLHPGYEAEIKEELETDINDGTMERVLRDAEDLDFIRTLLTNDNDDEIV